MKVAVVHDWLTEYAGSERVLEQILLVYPHADLYAVADFLPSAQRGFLGGRAVRTSAIQRLPLARRRFRQYLPLMPLAVEQFDLSGYDLVLSSSHAVAKGVLTGPDQLHVCYCHSPMRYAWDLQHEYLRDSRRQRGVASLVARAVLHYLRQWDARSANGVDEFVANSAFVARRIAKAYRRAATVIHPPVDTAAFTPGSTARADFYVTASRLVPYKRVDLIAAAFATMPSRRLVVIGDGPARARAQALAGPNVTFLGRQPHEVLRDHLRRARAFVFAAREDFGISPLEAQACGTPVIAFGAGGALETVRGLGADGPTGVFFAEQSVPALRDAVEAFEARHAEFVPRAARANAERFAPERFRAELRAFVEACWRTHADARGRRSTPGPFLERAG